MTFVPNGKESFKGLDANAINSAPVVVPLKGDIAGPSVLKTQVYLDRAGFSVGALDGRWGRNTAIALWWFQRSRGLTATEPGALDEQTFRALAAGAGQVALVQSALTEEDVKGPFVPIPEDVYDKAKLDCLCYETLQGETGRALPHHRGVPRPPESGREASPTLHAGDSDLGAERARSADAGSAGHRPRRDLDPRQHLQRLRRRRQPGLPRPDDARLEIRPLAATRRCEVKKITLDPQFHYQPTLFHEVPDSEPEAQPTPGSELTSGRRLDRAHQAALRNPWDVGSGLDRLRLLPRLRASHELGRRATSPIA